MSATITTDQTTDQTTTDVWGFGGEVDETSTKIVVITDAVRKGLDRAVIHFAKPSTKVDPASSRVLSVNFKTDDESDTFRRQVQQYADEAGLYVGFPKFSPEHVSKKTGKTVPANKTPKHYNTGTNVTFRVTAHREKTEEAEVTITNVADKK
jgi:hypothetical protein